MGNRYFNLNAASQPEACLSGTVLLSPVSLVEFGFDAEMVERSQRAYIYVHSSEVVVKWAQDYPRVQPTEEADVSGYRRHIVEPAPVPAVNDGHGVGAQQEREIIGQRQIQNLRMMSPAGGSLVTITLES